MDFVVVLLLVVVIAAVVISSRKKKEAELTRRRLELEPVKKFAFEDITALGEELQTLDLDLVGSSLDAGANADYQRALDAYEAAKTAGDAIQRPEDLKHVTEILEDGRYAIACVKARVAREPLPTRRPPCFFDPRHGLSVEDVPYTPPGGARRDVPACTLDAERVRAGAEPDIRKVMVGAQRVPYWQGGQAYAPWAQGYYSRWNGSDLLTGALIGGFLFGGGGNMFAGVGDGIADIGEGIGDGIGGLGEGLGDMFGDIFGD